MDVGYIVDAEDPTLRPTTQAIILQESQICLSTQFQLSKTFVPLLPSPFKYSDLLLSPLSFLFKVADD